MKIIAGATAHFSYRTRDTAGVLTDPDAVVAWIKTPDDTVSTTGVTITFGVTTGVVDVTVDTTDQLGVWFVETTMTGTGIVNQTVEDTICVVGSSVA